MNTRIVQETWFKQTFRSPRVKALVDLLIMFFCLTLALPVLLLFGSYMKTKYGLLAVILVSLTQFSVTGLGALLVLWLRKEKLKTYGIRRVNLGLSLFTGLVFAFIIVALTSLKAGAILWIPLYNHSMTHLSLTLGFPANVIGLTLVILFWGPFEGFYYVVVTKKLEDLIGWFPRNPWFSPTPFAFVVYSALFHWVVYTTEGKPYPLTMAGIIIDIVMGYAMFIPRKQLGNSWGSLLVQTIQNGIGKL